jgi:hypothetical protein
MKSFLFGLLLVAAVFCDEDAKADKKEEARVFRRLIPADTLRGM